MKKIEAFYLCKKHQTCISGSKQKINNNGREVNKHLDYKIILGN